MSVRAIFLCAAVFIAVVWVVVFGGLARAQVSDSPIAQWRGYVEVCIDAADGSLPECVVGQTHSAYRTERACLDDVVDRLNRLATAITAEAPSVIVRARYACVRVSHMHDA